MVFLDDLPFRLPGRSRHGGDFSGCGRDRVRPNLVDPPPSFYWPFANALIPPGLIHHPRPWEVMPFPERPLPELCLPCFLFILSPACTAAFRRIPCSWPGSLSVLSSCPSLCFSSP